MYKEYKSKHHEGIIAVKPYSYSTQCSILQGRSLICNVDCDQIENSKAWEEIHQEPVYKEMIFRLTPSQVEKFEKWRKKKYNKNKMKTYIFSFGPTGIGTVEKVVCSDGDELDLTDYSNW